MSGKNSKTSAAASAKAVSNKPKASNQDPAPAPTSTLSKAPAPAATPVTAPAVTADPVPLVVPVAVPTETVSNVGQTPAPPAVPPPPKPVDNTPVIVPPKVAAPAPAPAPAPSANAVTVYFVDSSVDLPSDITSQKNCVVYVRGSLRDENLSTKAPVNGLSRSAVLTQVENLVQYCRSKQPQCVQPGSIWIYAGAVITVNGSVNFSQFRYDTVLVRPGTSLSAAPTGNAAASANDLVLSASEIGKDITLTLPGSSSVTVSQWVQNAAGAFVGFSVSWQGPAGSYVVTDLDGNVYAVSSSLFASLDSSFSGVASVDFTDSMTVSTSDLDRLPYFVVQQAQAAF
jgi:hypothetical protein